MFRRFSKKFSLMEKILILLMIILLFSYLNPKREGFENVKKDFVLKGGNDVFDDFYVSVYDKLLYSEQKNNYEMQELKHSLEIPKNSDILDVGCGTGHQVELFNQQKHNCIGVDKSEAMIKQAKKNYPNNNYEVKDIMNSISYEPGSFDMITCFYFTFYYIEDKKTFMKNCMEWLVPGGYLVIHLVDRKRFDPIIPPANPFVMVSPQKYAKKRITDSTVKFNNFTYTADFNLKEKDDIAIFKERFKFKDNKKTRENEHKFYMEKHSDIVSMAKKIGLILDGRIDLVKANYEHQYLYVFKTPQSN